MRFTILFLCFKIITAAAFAQRDVGHWRMGVNPLGLAESQMSVGPAASYRISKRLELWTEASFIFANAYMPEQWIKMKGWRFILQPRYYFGERGAFFVTPEFRIKTFSFDNRLTFFNETTRDTLQNFSFRERQLILGGALVFGRRYNLSKKHGIDLEVTAGLGGKHRLIKRKNIPVGYEVQRFEKRNALAPGYEDHNTGTVLCPLGLRFMWNL